MTVKERKDIIEREVSELDSEFATYFKEYNFGKSLRSVVFKKYDFEFAPEPGDFMDVVRLLLNTLTLIGLTDEEAHLFLLRNKELMNVSYNEIIIKLSILYRIRLLKSVFFKNPYVLKNMRGGRLTSNRLYALICYYKNKGVELTYEKVFEVNFSDKSWDLLCKTYNLEGFPREILKSTFLEAIKISNLESEINKKTMTLN